MSHSVIQAERSLMANDAQLPVAAMASRSAINELSGSQWDHVLSYSLGKLIKEYIRLSRDNEKLSGDNEKLSGDNEELRRRIAELETDSSRHADRVSELERSAALDSTNSGKPPSSDGLRKKGAKDSSKRNRSLRGKSNRKSGGQPGHKGHTLKQSDTPDRVIDHVAEHCSQCGHSLPSDSDSYTRRQVFDLPQPAPLEVIEHRAHQTSCSTCGCVSRGQFPLDVKAPVQYGPHLTTTVSYLHHAQFIPLQRLSQTVQDLFGISMSTATVCAMCRRIANRFEDLQQHIAELIRTEAAIKHLDETGFRIETSNRWTHVTSTTLLTALRLGESRGDVGQGLTGIIVHDDFSSYFALEGVTHAACNVHHMRELKAVIELDGEDWAQSMKRLLERAYRVWYSCQTNQRTVPLSLQQAFSTAWDRILQRALIFHEALPPLRSGRRGRRKRRKGHNLALRLQRNKQDCLRFLEDPKVPYSNNTAETDLRMVKLRQKISGGFRTEDGARQFLTMRSIIQTSRKQGWKVIETLSHQNPLLLSGSLRM